MKLSSNMMQSLIGSLLIVTGAIGFSAKAILVKLAYAEQGNIDAISLMAWRMLLSLPFFLIVAVLSRENNEQKPNQKDWGALILLGMMGYYLASYLDFTGLQYISAGLERLILFLYPSLVVFLSVYINKKPLKRQQIIAIALSYGGILLVFDGGLESPNVLLGSSLVFASALVFAIFITASGHYIPRFGARRFTAYSMTIACIATLLHFFATQPLEKLEISPEVLQLSLILAIFSTVIPAFLVNAGIQRVGASKAAIISTIGPVATLVMGYYILHEPLSLDQFLGSALVITGATMVTVKK